MVFRCTWNYRSLFSEVSETVEEYFHSGKSFIQLLSGDRICTAEMGFPPGAKDAPWYHCYPLLF